MEQDDIGICRCLGGAEQGLPGEESIRLVNDVYGIRMTFDFRRQLCFRNYASSRIIGIAEPDQAMPGVGQAVLRRARTFLGPAGAHGPKRTLSLHQAVPRLSGEDYDMVIESTGICVFAECGAEDGAAAAGEGMGGEIDRLCGAVRDAHGIRGNTQTSGKGSFKGIWLGFRVAADSIQPSRQMPLQPGKVYMAENIGAEIGPDRAAEPPCVVSVSLDHRFPSSIS